MKLRLPLAFIATVTLSLLLANAAYANHIPGHPASDPKSINGTWTSKDTIQYQGGTYRRYKDMDIFVREGDGRDGGCIRGDGLGQDGGGYRVIRGIGQVSGGTQPAQHVVYDYVLGSSNDRQPYVDCEQAFDKDGDLMVSQITLEEPQRGNTTGNTGPDDQGGNPDEDCEAGGGLSWIVCAVLDFLEGAIRGIETRIIEPFLRTEPLSTENNDTTFTIWRSFRDLANIGFVFAFLVIIFGNVFSFNIDAYTIKRSLPRLVIAAIAVQFSFLFSSVLVDISNVLGQGLLDLIDLALPAGQKISGGPGTSTAVLGVSGIVLGAVALASITLSGTVLLVVLGAFIAFLGVLFTLVLRKVLIILLVILAPLAFVAWVLPNTENMFKLWYKTFTKTLMMYPMIMLLFGAGKIFSVAASSSGGSLGPLFALIGLVVPLFMIPATFKFAGVGIAAIGGVITRRAGEYQGALKGSQFAKDVRQGGKERATLLAQEGKNPVKRFFGRTASGNILPTAQSKRRLAGAYAKIKEERGKEFEGQLNALNLEPDDFNEAISQVAQGNSVHGLEVNEYTQAKAIDLMAKRRQYDNLRQVSGMVQSGQISQRVWGDGIRDSFGDLFERTPDIVLPPDRAFGGMTAERLASLHPSSAQQYSRYLASTPAGSAARQTAVNALMNLAQNRTLRSRVHQGTTQSLLANAQLFQDVDTGIAREVGGQQVPVDGYRYIIDTIDPTGRLLDPRQAGSSIGAEPPAGPPPPPGGGTVPPTGPPGTF